MAGSTPCEPARDCAICARLVAFRQETRAAEPDWHNAPVPSFGDVSAQLLIVGLAPGLRGANRTGRPFTGDFAGDLLYETLLLHNFARGAYAARADDGLLLVDCRISNAVRCVPPQNKPTPVEIHACRPFLEATLGTMPNLTSIVALGKIAHDSVVRACGEKLARAPFGHGAEHMLLRPDGKKIILFDSYHCSRYNTNTGVLTAQMFRAIFQRVRVHIDAVRPMS